MLCEHLSFCSAPNVSRVLNKKISLALCSECEDIATGGVVLVGGQTFIKPTSNKKKKKAKEVFLSFFVDQLTGAQKDTAKADVKSEPAWICLVCGNLGCGRNSDEKHALTHATSKKNHPIAMNVLTLQVWCYTCDSEVLFGTEGVSAEGQVEAEAGAATSQDKLRLKLLECTVLEKRSNLMFN